MNEIHLKGSPNRGLIGTSLGFFFGAAAVSLFGPSAAKFKDAMDLSPAMLGLLVAIPSLSGSLLRIPFGAWVDTTGGRKPFLILLLLSIIGLGGLTTLLYLEYPNNMHGYYPLVLLFGCLSGCGIATFSVGIGQTSYWFPQKEQGRTSGIFGGVGNAAPGVFALILPLYLSTFGLISAYFAWSVFLVIGIVLYFFIGENAYYFQYLQSGMSDADSKAAAKLKGEELFPSGNVKQSLMRSAKVPQTWMLVAIYFSTFGGFVALTAWFPSFWHLLYKFDPVIAGAMTAAFAIFSALLRIPGGSLSDRFGGEKICMISMCTLLIAATGMSFVTTHAYLSLFFAVLIAGAMGVNNGAVFKLVPKYVPQSVGGAAGWVGGFGGFGGFAIPPVLGWIAMRYGEVGYARGFIVFSVLAIINIAILYFGLIRKSKNNVGRI